MSVTVERGREARLRLRYVVVYGDERSFLESRGRKLTLEALNMMVKGYANEEIIAHLTRESTDDRLRKSIADPSSHIEKIRFANGQYREFLAEGVRSSMEHQAQSAQRVADNGYKDLAYRWAFQATRLGLILHEAGLLVEGKDA